MVKYLERAYVLEDKPLPWQRMGLQYTVSGYGAKIPSSKVLRLLDGKIRRVYVTNYSNSGSAWVILDGERFFLHG
jgi:hypothetical protein